jgi:cell division septation protein DedD
MGTTTTDDAFHEIQLNGKQLVFLFMSTVVILVVVFLFGVLVGRGVSGDRGPLDALTQPEVPPVVADTAVPAVAPSGAPTAANEELTYPNRLSNNKPAPEKLRAAGERSPAPAVAAPAPAAPATAPAQTRAPEPTPPAAAPAPSASAAMREPSGAGFAIQVAALRQRAEADGVARSLATKGYPAYVMNPESGAPAVFRVRVGKFKDRTEAETVAARLQKEEQFKPWIVR